MNRTQIISKISIILGNGKVQDYLDPKPFVQSANEILDFVIETAFSEHDWKFGTKSVYLSPITITITDTVTNPLLKRFRYKFKLPADYLAVDEMMDEPYYQIFNDNTVYTNARELKLIYKFMPDITLFPTYFDTYLIYEVAANMGIAAAQQDTYATYLSDKAAGALAKAKYIDSQNQENKPIQSNPFLEARATNGFQTYEGDWK